MSNTEHDVKKEIHLIITDISKGLSIPYRVVEDIIEEWDYYKGQRLEQKCPHCKKSIEGE